MDHFNPILTQGFAVGGQTRHLTLVESPTPKSKPSVPPAIKKLISELGLRYRPTSQADLEAHAHALALLCSDLADMPANLLARAIAKHVMESPYLPKASDLVKIAKSFIPTRPHSGPEGETTAERLNRLMDQDPNSRRDIRWFQNADGQGAHLETIGPVTGPVSA